MNLCLWELNTRPQWNLSAVIQKYGDRNSKNPLFITIKPLLVWDLTLPVVLGHDFFSGKEVVRELIILSSPVSPLNIGHSWTLNFIRVCMVYFCLMFKISSGSQQHMSWYFALPAWDCPPRKRLKTACVFRTQVTKPCCCHCNITGAKKEVRWRCYRATKSP